MNSEIFNVMFYGFLCGLIVTAIAIAVTVLINRKNKRASEDAGLLFNVPDKFKNGALVGLSVILVVCLVLQVFSLNKMLDMYELLNASQVQSVSVKAVVNEQEKAEETLECEESCASNPYPIITENNSLSAAYATTDMGTMYFGDTSVHLYYSYAQSVVDAYDSAAVLTEALGSDPIGVPGGCSFVGDHNYQTGYLMGGTKIGDKIYVETPYGQFLYQVYRIGTASCDSCEFYMNDDGMRVISAAKSGQLQGLVLFTCYPFDSLSGAQRYMVFAELIDGTVLS